MNRLERHKIIVQVSFIQVKCKLHSHINYLELKFALELVRSNKNTINSLTLSDSLTRMQLNSVTKSGLLHRKKAKSEMRLDKERMSKLGPLLIICYPPALPFCSSPSLFLLASKSDGNTNGPVTKKKRQEHKNPSPHAEFFIEKQPLPICLLFLLSFSFSLSFFAD